MKRIATVLAAFGLLTVACDGGDTTAPMADGLRAGPQFDGAGVVHHASLGGADVCEALGFPTGCDANFSLVANQKSDGSVSGEWSDIFPGGGQGIHVRVDCLRIAGNAAVVGGVITKGTAGNLNFAGLRAVTAVVDNGTSTNDPPDQLSFSVINPSGFGLPNDCSPTPGVFPLLLFNLTNGQVTVY